MLAIAIALAGCAGFQNTPRQNYIFGIGRQCESYGAVIQRVAPDGSSYQVFWTGGAATWPEFQACLDAAMRARPFIEAEWK